MKPQNGKPSDRQYPATVSPPGANLPATEVREAVPDFDESADLRTYLEIVMRHKWLVLTFLVGVFVTTLIVSLSMQPVFKANGKIEVSLRSPKVTKFEDVMATQLQTREFMQTQVKLLQSESLTRRVIEKLQLDKNPVFNPAVDQEDSSGGFMQALKAAVKSWIPLGSREEEADPALARLQLEKSMEVKFTKSLEVQPERDTALISLAFSSTDAALARDIVNALLQEFISWEMDKRIDAAGAAKQQLEKQLEVARIQLESAESSLNKFAQKAGIVSLESNLNLVYRQLEEINKAYAAAEADRIAKESLASEAAKGNISSLPLTVENALIQQLRQEHAKLTAEYQDQLSTFKDDYPKMKNLRARIQDVEKRIRIEEMRILDSIKSDYFAALKKEQTLKEEAETKKIRALELNDRAIQYKVLQREVETSKLIHSSLLERSKEIDANVGTELGKIQVVDYAALPLTPYKPNVRLNLLLAIVVGLMGGVGLAFFMEYLDNTVKRIDEISDRFRIPVLGVLPMADAEELADLDYIVRTKPKSSFAESIRTAKVSIQLSSSTDEPPKSFLITSTTMGEGKSTISANLAQAFATAEERVIIVDADMRRPRLHKIFNGNGVPSVRRRGLSQYLTGLCKIEEIIQRTEVPNLCFVSAGPIPPNPAELLASSRMKQFLEKISRHFDRVIVDSPPAAGFADVLVLSNCVDGVILVSTLGQTHRDALRIFRRSIFNVRGHLLGAIVNKLDISHRYGGYYYKYYNYYHYYYHPNRGDDAEKLPEGRPLQEEAPRV